MSRMPEELLEPSATGSMIRAFLKSQDCRTSFPRKADAQAFIRSLYWMDTFPWNDDQREILRASTTESVETVVQGVFGSGKTTLMTGLFHDALLSGALSPSQILFCSFNISIRNELRKKTRVRKTRPHVRTFDSMIYEVCRHHGMEHLEKPDYEGRRRFVERRLVLPPPHGRRRRRSTMAGTQSGWYWWTRHRIWIAWHTPSFADCSRMPDSSSLGIFSSASRRSRDAASSGSSSVQPRIV